LKFAAFDIQVTDSFMKFSQRYGYTPIKDKIQCESMDDELRIGLWNVFKLLVVDGLNDNVYSSSFDSYVRSLWIHFFKLPVDSIPRKNSLHSSSPTERIREWFFKQPWFEVYDLIEFTVQMDPSNFDVDNFIEVCNYVLKKELSGYRFIDKKICPITNESEILSIEESILSTANPTLKSANIHLKDALSKVSDRKNPDYRNSIKESISAVESLAKIISGKPKATLGEVLGKLKPTIQIHPALEEGFKKIYGYTSDSHGIRHCLMDESNLDFEDAKFMLVSCCAFINYLIEKAQKAGIKLN